MVLERICAAGITLILVWQNYSYLFINQHGISPDPLQAADINETPPPKTLSELRRFMGMINQLRKFSPNIAEISTQYCRNFNIILSSNQVWQRGPNQEDSYKNLQTKPTVLKLYNAQIPTKISADTSSYSIRLYHFNLLIRNGFSLHILHA